MYNLNNMTKIGCGAECKVYDVQDLDNAVLKVFRGMDEKSSKEVTLFNRTYAKLFDKLNIGPEVYSKVFKIEKIDYDYPDYQYGYLCEKVYTQQSGWSESDYKTKFSYQRCKDLKAKIEDLTNMIYWDNHRGNLGYRKNSDKVLCIDTGLSISIKH